MSDKIFQSSDLASARRVDFLNEARSGRARLRDKDGTSLVMLPESQLELLEELASWHVAHSKLAKLLAKGSQPSVGDLGELAWLRAFDLDEMHEFLDELDDALVASSADVGFQPLRDCVSAWRTTARQLEDPLRRSVLRGQLSADDLVEVPRPETSEPDERQ
jgi:hypothetical protein